MREYDSIVSLGGFCGAAAQLRIRGLRTCSMPFDWLYMESEESIKYLARAFQNDFKDFCLKENLALVPQSQDLGGVAKYKYRDSLSKFVFIHHFHESIDKGGYEKTYSTIKRRVDRFLSAFKPGKSVLLILATRFEYDLSLAARLLDSIREKFPGTSVDLHVIQFAAKLSDPLALGEKIPLEYPFSGEKYSRPQGEYDINYTSSEWAFLDQVRLRNHEYPKMRGFAKFKFKLWKSLSKYLRNEGYGCSGIRFTLKK